MEEKTNILTGGQLIANRTIIIKDLPIVGLKEFKPSNSWLEGKQIHTSLEERYNLLREERVEKRSSLNIAYWIPEEKKAKVTKKVGKAWEIFGHHKDNEDWLSAEEALYLLETNDLQLFFGDVCLTLERGYTLLLDPENGTSLNEYRTFSFLLKYGYKLIRHSPDVTVTRYEKQINLDQCVKSQRREPPPGPSSSQHKSQDLSSDDVEEITIIETNKELICINDSPSEELPQSLEVESCQENEIVIPDENINSKGERVSQSSRKENHDDIICIDDDEDYDDHNIDDISSSSNASNSTDSEDVVFISSAPATPFNRKIISSTFSSISNFLHSTEGDAGETIKTDVIDLCDEERCESDIKMVLNKNREDILDEFPCADKSIALIRTPDDILIPRNIKPRFKEYKVNLNVRPQVKFQYRHRPFYRRPYNNVNNFSPVRYANVNRFPIENTLMRRAQEMQVMAMGMLQVASTLMTSAQNTQLWHMGQPNGLVNSPNAANGTSGGIEANTSSLKYPSSTPYSDISTQIIENRRFTSNYQRRFSLNDPSQNSYFRYGRPSNFQRRSFPSNNRGYQMRRSSTRYFSREDRLVPLNSRGIFETVDQVGSWRKPPEVVTIDTDDEDDDVKMEPLEVNKTDCEMQDEAECNPRKRIKRDSSPESILADSESHSDRERSSTSPSVKQEMANDNNTEKRTNVENPTTRTVKEECTVVDNTTRQVKTEGEVHVIDNSDENDREMLPQVKNENDPNRSQEAVVETAACDNVLTKTEVTDSRLSTNESEPEVNSQIREETNTSFQNDNNENINDSVINTVDHKDVYLVESCSTGAREFENVTTWEQYKKQQENNNGLSGKDNTFVDQPLLQMDSCSSIESVLSSLQIFDRFELPEFYIRKLKISYDVYLPNTPFKKSMKVLPNYRVIVLRYDEEIPSSSELLFLQKEYQDEIPFLFAIVLEESVAFYMLSSVSLPIEIDQ